MSINYNLLFLFVISLLTLVGCNKDIVDDQNSIPDFTIKATPGFLEAEITWDLSKNDSSISYSIYLGNALITQNSRDQNFVFKNLQEQTFYSGKVVALDNENNTKEVSFSFYTLLAQPPANFQLVTNAITSDSISISWESPIDPQGSTVLFDIYLNNKIVSKDQTKPGLDLGGLDPHTVYYIKVVARNSFIKTTSSSTYFITMAAGDAKLLHKNMVCQGLKREYGYYLPSGISNTIPALLIYLHGAAGVAWPELTASPLKDIAEREKFIVAMPQALKGSTIDGTYLQWNAHEVLAWDDVLFIENMIDTLSAKYKVNKSRIYLCGMSNGGFMAFYAASRSHKFAAIAPMSGLMSSNIYAKYKTDWPLPLLYIHGTADNIVPYNGQTWMPPVEDVINFWVKNNNCDTAPLITQLPDIAPNDGSTVTLFNYKGMDPKSEISFYRINGGGHSIAGYEPGANQDFSAFEAIWGFVKTKSR
ncbi:MAG: fibronectin type III domain-containing protein [Bacteroidales bacterium]